LIGVALRFLNEPSPDRAYVLMGIDDIPPVKGDVGGDNGGCDPGPDGVLRYGHIPLAERERIIAGICHTNVNRGRPASPHWVLGSSIRRLKA
jgi:hypothetical protein